MKKLSVMLAAAFLAFGCSEDLFLVNFDYPFEAEFTVEDPIPAQQDYVIESEAFDIEVIEEIAERNLGNISAVQLKSLKLYVLEGHGFELEDLEYLSAEAYLDNEVIQLASLGDQLNITDNSIELVVNAEEIQLLELLEKETAQARLTVRTKAEVPAGVQLKAKIVAKIFASPVQ